MTATTISKNEYVTRAEKAVHNKHYAAGNNPRGAELQQGNAVRAVSEAARRANERYDLSRLGDDLPDPESY